MDDKIPKDENKKILEVIALGIGFSFEQMEQLINNLDFVRNSGYGKVTISVKRGKIYNMAFTVESEPEKL